MSDAEELERLIQELEQRRMRFYGLKPQQPPCLAGLRVMNSVSVNQAVQLAQPALWVIG